MIKVLEFIKSYYLREFLSRPLRQVKIYIGLLILELIAFSLLGYKFDFFNIVNKYNQTKSTLSDIEIIDTKISILDKLSRSLSEAEKYTAALNNAMPSTNDIDNYLVSFVRAAATSGFEVLSFSVEEGADVTSDEARILAILSGEPTFVVELVKNIESLPRLTFIDKLQIDYMSGENTKVNMNLTLKKYSNKIVSSDTIDIEFLKSLEPAYEQH